MSDILQSIQCTKCGVFYHHSDPSHTCKKEVIELWIQLSQEQWNLWFSFQRLCFGSMWRMNQHCNNWKRSKDDAGISLLSEGSPPK